MSMDLDEQTITELRRKKQAERDLLAQGSSTSPWMGALAGLASSLSGQNDMGASIMAARNAPRKERITALDKELETSGGQLEELAKYRRTLADRKAEQQEDRSYKEKQTLDERKYNAEQEKSKRDYEALEKAKQRAFDKEIAGLKAKEKTGEMSVAEAKQRGLYESGVLANQQYEKALADGSFDPTASFQWIDKSGMLPNIAKDPKAVEALSAQDAWVEAFLRDASGAAIPPSERGAYAKDFFPQGGDSTEVVQNKARLRAQKMENARVASGLPADRAAMDQIPPLVQAPGSGLDSAKAARLQELRAKRDAGTLVSNKIGRYPGMIK